MPLIPAGDIELYYERGGEGPRVLFISGTGSDLRVRPGVFDGPFAKAFDLLAYDHRGLGRSGKPPAPYTMAQYGDDAAALLDAIGWDRVPVIGVSFGGMVAQELVLRHPDRVSRLVLACTSPGGAGGASYPLHTLPEDRLERARMMVSISDTRHDADWIAAHREDYKKIVAFTATDPFEGEPGRAEGARAQVLARADHDTWGRLPGIACPVMIAAGRYDGVALPETQERMAARIPGAALRFFEGGHMFMIQDKTAAPAMIEFLKA